MNALNYVKAMPTRLQELGYNEYWLQARIADDPSILGLGNLYLVKKEKLQYTGGRIDFVLGDENDETRYEVEVMRGSLDESHIIRTIEYWDIERQRYPAYRHCAVIVAEEITSRFFNVIRLLNRAVPIVAIQLSAFKFEQNIVLQFVKVLNEFEYSGDVELEAEPADHAYWVKRSTAKSLSMVDEVVALVVAATGKKPEQSYRQQHIALMIDGDIIAKCRPFRAAAQCAVRFKVKPEARRVLVDRLAESGLTAKSIDQRSVRLVLSEEDLTLRRDVLLDAFQQAEVW